MPEVGLISVAVLRLPGLDPGAPKIESAASPKEARKVAFLGVLFLLILSYNRPAYFF